MSSVMPCFALRSEGEDIPGEDINPDAAIGCLLHDPAPELDFSSIVRVFHDFVIGEHFRTDETFAGKAERIIELRVGTPDSVEGDLGNSGTSPSRERMKLQSERTL